MDPLLEETAERILKDHTDDPAALWAALDANGLTQLWVSEANGGFGLPASDGFGLVRLAGYHAAPVALVETLLASWFLEQAGMAPLRGAVGILISGWQRDVPFGGDVAHVVKIDGHEVSVFAGNFAGQSTGVGLDPAAPVPSDWGGQIAGGRLVEADPPAFAALVRATQICGALDAALDLSIAFADQREQFGRSLSKFQAIQHLLSEMALECAAASAAVDAAVGRLKPDAPLDRLLVGTAKFRSSLAAGIVSEHAHQIHGAIGYTQEYPLARLTRRLWQWREDFGGEGYWADEIGRAALAGSGPLWPRLTAGVLS